MNKPFKAGDKVKLTRDCSGAKKNKVYTLERREGDLWAGYTSAGLGCLCSDNWNLVSRRRMKAKAKKVRTVSIPSLIKRVKKGIVYLNRTQKGWYNDVDIQLLNLKSGTACILGQLYEDFWEKVTSASSQKEKGKMKWREAVSRGFVVDDEEASDRQEVYDVLTRIWYVKIMALRGLK